MYKIFLVFHCKGIKAGLTDSRFGVQNESTVMNTNRQSNHLGRDKIKYSKFSNIGLKLIPGHRKAQAAVVLRQASRKQDRAASRDQRLRQANGLGESKLPKETLLSYGWAPDAHSVQVTVSILLNPPLPLHCVTSLLCVQDGGTAPSVMNHHHVMWV